MMNKKFDVAVLGEILIDFTECGISESGQALFERNPGGAVANLACEVSRLGGKSAFIGIFVCHIKLTVNAICIMTIAVYHNFSSGIFYHF